MNTLQRLPTSGKIRPGIKVLTAKAAGINGTAKVYEEGIRAGSSFDEIAKNLIKISGCPETPLVPRNVPFFRVSGDDFTAPESASEIMRYAGEDGKLYGFPVIFPSDDIGLVFREGFEAWRSSELSFWSEVNPATGALDCKKRQQVRPVNSLNRRKHFWGGRQVEAVGPCNPNSCDLFGSGGCKHHGTLYFYVPGCHGVGLIELDFTSIYASLGISEILTFVLSGLGHIKGTHHGRPIFWVSKQKKDCSRVDWEKGKTERTEQWIISIEARGLDMFEVFASQELGEKLLAAPPPDPQIPEQISPTNLPEQPFSLSVDDSKRRVEDLRRLINGMVADFGINVSDFAKRQASDFGTRWSKEERSLLKVHERFVDAKITGDFSDLLPAIDPPLTEPTTPASMPIQWTDVPF